MLLPLIHDDNNIDGGCAKGDDKKATKEEEALVAILLKCRHFMASASSSIQYLALSIINEGIHALSHNSNQLLPVVAQLWQPFRSRFILEAKHVTSTTNMTPSTSSSSNKGNAPNTSTSAIIFLEPSASSLQSSSSSLLLSSSSSMGVPGIFKAGEASRGQSLTPSSLVTSSSFQSQRHRPVFLKALEALEVRISDFISKPYNVGALGWH
jgi:hypothetical protein